MIVLSLSHFNFFIPFVKLVEKYRQGSKIIKKYDKPKTPFQRILESQYIPEKTKIRLQKFFNELNPFELQKTMTWKIKLIISEANEWVNSFSTYPHWFTNWFVSLIQPSGRGISYYHLFLLFQNILDNLKNQNNEVHSAEQVFWSNEQNPQQ